MSEQRRWRLYDESEDYAASWSIERDGPQPPALEYAEVVEVMPVSEYERLRDAVRVLLKAKDGAVLDFDDDRWAAVRSALEEGS